MARFKILADDVITNIIEADADFAASIGATPAEDDEVIGMVWNGEVFAFPTLPIAERKAQMIASVSADRDRRIRLPFSFAGSAFDYDVDSQKRITGAASLAGFAMTLGGKQPDDPLWHGGDTPFTWIAADNSFVQLDAQSTFALGQAAAAWESAHVFAARALKDAIEAAPDAASLDAIDINAGWPG